MAGVPPLDNLSKCRPLLSECTAPQKTRGADLVRVPLLDNLSRCRQLLSERMSPQKTKVADLVHSPVAAGLLGAVEPCMLCEALTCGLHRRSGPRRTPWPCG